MTGAANIDATAAVRMIFFMFDLLNQIRRNLS
jgi:hypothetical protein